MDIKWNYKMEKLDFFLSVVGKFVWEKTFLDTAQKFLWCAHVHKRNLKCIRDLRISPPNPLLGGLF